jgi:hypothetical protein
MPFSSKAPALFGYLGVDITLAPTVHLIPNVERTVYDEATDGSKPGSDLVPRLTLFVSW